MPFAIFAIAISSMRVAVAHHASQYCLDRHDDGGPDPSSLDPPSSQFLFRACMSMSEAESDRRRRTPVGCSYAWLRRHVEYGVAAPRPRVWVPVATQQPFGSLSRSITSSCARRAPQPARRGGRPQPGRVSFRSSSRAAAHAKLMIRGLALTSFTFSSLTMVETCGPS